MRTLKAALLVASMSGLGVLAHAQEPPPPPPPPGAYSQDAGPRGAYGPDTVMGLVDRVHDDLSRAYGGYRFRGGDRGRLNNAEKQLRDFAQKWRRGKFDKGELDDAISSIQHVLDNNRMTVDARRDIDRDVNDLRGLREAYDRHELPR